MRKFEIFHLMDPKNEYENGVKCFDPIYKMLMLIDYALSNDYNSIKICGQDVKITDINLSGLLSLIKTITPGTISIVLSQLLQTIKVGMTEYIAKPLTEIMLVDKTYELVDEGVEVKFTDNVETLLSKIHDSFKDLYAIVRLNNNSEYSYIVIFKVQTK